MKTLKVALQVLATGAIATGMAAHASLVTGYVWENNPTTDWETGASADGTVPASSSTIYTETSLAAGTLAGNSAPNFFSTVSGNINANYTISSFLASGGYTFSANAGYSGNDNLDNTLFEFVGQVYVTQGETISISDDDGVVLNIGNQTVVYAPHPQDVGNGNQGTFTGATGVYNFTLYYAEVDGAPADLDATLPVVPEPSSIVAGVLLLLPFGISTVRVLRRKEVA